MAAKRASTSLRSEFWEAVESLGTSLKVYDKPDSPVVVHIGYVVNDMHPASTPEKVAACKNDS